MANLIEKAALFQKALDRAMIQGAVTGFMENNLTDLIYNGGDEVKIPSVQMQGLADYDRATGFTEGDVTLKYDTVKLTQDRGRGFTLDEMDVDESGALDLMSQLAGEFQRTKVVPEVDAYRISQIVKLAGKDQRAVYAPAEGTILGRLQSDIDAARDECGGDEQLVVLMSIPTLTLMKNSDKIVRKLDVASFVSGEIHTEVRALDGVSILPVPSKRMYSRIQLETAGEGGYKQADGAQAVNYIVLPLRAPLAVSKTDRIRLFDPETWQKARAWHMDYRKFHDVWLKKSAVPAVRVSLAAKDETLDPGE